MDQGNIKIAPLFNSIGSSKNENNVYTLCIFKSAVRKIEIDGIVHDHLLANTAFFMKPYHKWSITLESTGLAGYILYVPESVMVNPVLSNLRNVQVFLGHTAEVPAVTLAPNTAQKIFALVEMLDEFIVSTQNNKQEAILSLLKMIFIYADGVCSINFPITKSTRKSALVQEFREILNKKYSQWHTVAAYASSLNVSEKYLNESVKAILNYNPKTILDNALIFHSQRELKFTGKSIKEISYHLGFTSPEYFTYYFKKHTGNSPSEYRQKQLV